MKTFKQIKEEIANVSAGYGVRGFGDVSGTPKVGFGVDSEYANPHIERVSLGAEEYYDSVRQLAQNHSGLLDTGNDDDWWAKAGAKGTALTGLGKSNKQNNEEDDDNDDMSGNRVKGAGLDFDNVKRGGKSGRVVRSKIKNIIHEDIGGIAGTVGNNVGSGYIAGTGHPLEGKPSNWGEPGISKKKQAKHKVLRRTGPKLVGLDTLKEIPIQEEIKKGMFAGEETFVVPSHVYERAMNEKRKGKHWRTYIKDEIFHPAIREFAYKNPKKPIIFEDEKTGYMSYARYGRKRRK